MISSSRHHRRVALGLAAAAIVAGAPSLVVAAPSSSDEEGVVTVVEPGDPGHQVLLPGTVPAGAVADVTTSYDVEMTMSGSGLPISFDIDAVGEMARTSEVLEVGDGGGYTARETITSFELTMTEGETSDLGSLDLDDGPTADYGPIIDVPLIVEYDAAGNIDSLEAEAATVTPEQDELIEDLADEGFGMEGFGAVFPTTPVGEGAVWTVTDAEDPSGMGIPLAMRFELISLDENDYTIELSLDGDFAEFLETQASAEGAEVAGDMTLTGTITGDASNALDQQMSIDMVLDASVAEEGLAADIYTAFVIDHTSTPL